MIIKVTLLTVLIGLSLSQASTMDTCLALQQSLFTGNCASDYAVVTTAAVELNWCLKNISFKNLKLSAQDIICNCEDCHTIKGNGCLGGSVIKTLDYIKANSAVGGANSSYTSDFYTDVAGGPTGFVKCFNYFTPACDPDQEDCSSAKTFDTKTSCPTQCARTTTKTVAESKVSGVLAQTGSAYNTLKGKDAIKGAVDAGRVLIGFMEIFEDMDYYFGKDVKDDGVYIHTSGQSLGVVSILITGYKINDKGPNYWTVYVPWDKKFSDKIAGQRLNVIAGINHGNIENQALDLTLPSA